METLGAKKKKKILYYQFIKIILRKLYVLIVPFLIKITVLQRVHHFFQNVFLKLIYSLPYIITMLIIFYSLIHLRYYDWGTVYFMLYLCDLVYIIIQKRYKSRYFRESSFLEKNTF